MTESKDVQVTKDGKVNKRYRGKWSNRVLEKLYQAVGMGMPYEHAAIYAGIDKATFSNWRHGKFPRGVTAEERQEFREKLEAAEGQSIATKFGMMLRAANGEKDEDGRRMIVQPDWRAAAWLLERRYPEIYGAQVLNVTHRGDQDNPVRMDVEHNNTALNQRLDELFGMLTEQEQQTIATLNTRLLEIEPGE